MALHLSETDIRDSLSQPTNNSTRASSLATSQNTPRSPTFQDAPFVPASAPSRPTPLPAFTFPMKGPQIAASPRSAPSSFSRASGRRPMSAIELNGPVDTSDQVEGGRPKLPEFSFGGNASLSPQLSPRDIPSRSAFHKRGASEYIGGDGKTGTGMGLMSTSPTKGDNMLPTPGSTTSGPPAGRRGHAHRRSAAMSCHDLSMILKPDPSLARGGASAPTSPSAESHDSSNTTASLDSAIDSTNAGQSSTARPINRVRVAFSDNVETIPRPLSVVSSDSASTVKPGHSVNNSLSSIVSGDTPTPPITVNNELIHSAWAPPSDRPKTAEPYNDNTSPSEAPRRRNSIPLLAETKDVMNTGPLTPRSAKKWGFFGNESANGESSPKSRPTSATSAEASSTPLPSLEADPISNAIPASNALHKIDSTNSRRSSVSRKPSKKPKKVRTWAGSILSRKSRQRTQKAKLNRRSPTPPLRAYVEDQESMAFEQAASQEQQQTFIPDTNSSLNTWKARRVPSQEELSSPMIDLDAALGPFNTPTSPRLGEEWEMAQRGGTRKRTMHSAANNSSYLHRRAESAPEFENPRFGLHRLGSNSTMGMEDVFEEEEEEDWEDTKASDKGSSLRSGKDEDNSGLGIDIQVVDSDSTHADSEDAAYLRGIKRKGSGLSESDRRVMSSTKSEHSNRSVIDEPIVEEPNIVGSSHLANLPASDTDSKSSDKTATPPLRSAAKDLPPIDFHSYTLQPAYPTPTSPRSATHSSFPSPRSPFSYDTQRISTAPSSLNDEQSFQSLLMGEPGPEIRPSVDDVPSLTSSASTMTRENVAPAPAATNPQFREGQRSSSMSSAAISRKRSSMASLSRLISSSHGEKSKLNIESRPSTSGGLEKQEKTSRGKRISRLMQFWKPKDS